MSRPLEIPATPAPREASKGIMHSLVASRRVRAAAAFLALLSPSCAQHDDNPAHIPVPAAASQPPEHLPTPVHSGTQEHMHDHQNMTELLSKELAHPFNQDPGKWLDAHEKEWQECFDCSNEPVTETDVVCIDERMLMQAQTVSGKRVLRMAGSGVLWKNPDELADAIVAYVQQLVGARPLSSIKVNVSSHVACGAAGIAFGKDKDPDESARVYQRGSIVDKLKARGINAVHSGDAPMVKGPHTAIAAAVDCTDGRLQRLPGINAFTVSDPNNIPHAVEEAMLALKIASGSHAYSEKLKQFTFVIFFDPRRLDMAQEIESTLRNQTKEYASKGIDIRIVTRTAPAEK